MKVFLAVIIVSCIITVVISCVCFPHHLQQLYCQSDFVVHILARTKLKSPAANETRYEVLVLEVHKDDSGKIEQWSSKIIVTPGPLNSCKIDMARQQRYVLGGKFLNGEPFVRNCGRIFRRHKSLTDCERLPLRGGNYGCWWRGGGYNCDCKVINCYGSNNCKKPTRDECIWDRKNPLETGVCERVYGYGKNSGRCQWTSCRNVLNRY